MLLASRRPVRLELALPHISITFFVRWGSWGF